MRFRSRHQGLRRRDPRPEAFRSKDLVDVLRGELGPWLKEEGFKRLGSQAWIAPRGAEHVIVAVQCSQRGWENRSGNKFVVELELSREPRRATGYGRNRLWSLLDELSRHEVLKINSLVAQTLPEPDMRFLKELDPSTREHYLGWFAPSPQTIEDTDVWFAYYDETDASRWATFMSGRIGPALEKFLSQPPTFLGHPAQLPSD